MGRTKTTYTVGTQPIDQTKATAAPAGSPVTNDGGGNGSTGTTPAGFNRQAPSGYNLDANGNYVSEDGTVYCGPGSTEGCIPLSDPSHPYHSPDLSTKLEYFFGNASGNQHNIKRSSDMASQLNRIGISDSATGRAFFARFIQDLYLDPSSFVRIQENGRVVREGLLIGPGGMLMIQTVWEGDRLITGNIFGSNSRY